LSELWYKSMKFFPPKQAIENAKMAKRCLDRGSDAMTDVGRARMRQFIDKDPFTVKDLKSVSQFNRHRKNSIVPKGVKRCDDKGWVAWKGWGGDAGIRWAKNKLGELK